MTDNYYLESSRKGLLAEAVVVSALLQSGYLDSSYTTAGQAMQRDLDVDILGRCQPFYNAGLCGASAHISIKYQEAGKDFGTAGEFGFELYEVVAATGEQDISAFFRPECQRKLFAILQGGFVYLFTRGQLRSYLFAVTGDDQTFPKVRGLTQARRQKLADCCYRYTDTISGYIDVADFLAKEPFVKKIAVSHDLLDLMDRLLQASLSIEALRDTHYTVQLLNYAMVLTQDKTKATKRAMLDGLASLTNLYA